MERVKMRLEVHRAETLRLIDQHFREMVQKKEEFEESERQLQVGRGVMFGLEKAQETISEVQKEDELERVKQGTQEADAPPPFNQIADILGIPVDTLVDAWNIANKNHEKPLMPEVKMEDLGR
jgi:hypothetical protein